MTVSVVGAFARWDSERALKMSAHSTDEHEPRRSDETEHLRVVGSVFEHRLPALWTLPHRILQTVGAGLLRGTTVEMPRRKCHEPLSGAPEERVFDDPERRSRTDGVGHQRELDWDEGERLDIDDR